MHETIKTTRTLTRSLSSDELGRSLIPEAGENAKFYYQWERDTLSEWPVITGVTVIAEETVPGEWK